MWAWGLNGNGQLGDGSIVNKYKPIAVKDASGNNYLTGITAIAVGGNYSLALKNDGTVWAWGWNLYGQLGDNTTTNRSLPVQVKDSTGTGYISDVKAISAGENIHFL